MEWLYLTVAGVLEVAWAVGMKVSNGFTRPAASLFTLATLVGSLWLLALAARSLPLGTAYAVWTGIGVAGTAILGMLIFNEPRTIGRCACILAILTGIAGLRALSGRPDAVPGAPRAVEPIEGITEAARPGDPPG